MGRAKPGGFAYVGRGQSLEASLTWGEGKGWSLRLRGRGKGWRLRLHGERDMGARGVFLSACRRKLQLLLCSAEKGCYLRLRLADSFKHTKPYGEVEFICETRYFVYLRRLCPPLNTLILNHWSARTGLLIT